MPLLPHIVFLVKVSTCDMYQSMIRSHDFSLDAWAEGDCLSHHGEWSEASFAIDRDDAVLYDNDDENNRREGVLHRRAGWRSEKPVKRRENSQRESTIRRNNRNREWLRASYQQADNEHQNDDGLSDTEP